MISKSFKVAPLGSTFMLTSIVGFIISAYYWQELTPSWAFTFIIVFSVMFISSLISLERAPVDALLAIERKKK